MTPVGKKVVNGQHLNGDPLVDPVVEVSEGKDDFGETAREHEGRRAGLLLVIIGVVLMALAATEAVATEDGSHDPATSSSESRLEASL